MTRAGGVVVTLVLVVLVALAAWVFAGFREALMLVGGVLVLALVLWQSVFG